MYLSSVILVRGVFLEIGALTCFFGKEIQRQWRVIPVLGSVHRALKTYYLYEARPLLLKHGQVSEIVVSSGWTHFSPVGT